jgi:hypothetical protein
MSKSLWIVCCVVGLSASAFAEDTWTETVAFSRGDTSAIKVFEPEGYTASVTIGGETQKDQVPTVLRVPDGDAFYVVTMVAPSGSKWSKKIETKKGRITELRVKHTAAAAAQPGGSARKFFGKFALSTKLPCAADNSSTRVDFVTADGATAATFTIPSGKGITGEVPEGEFSVRTFRVDADGTATYRNTRTASIKADGWVGTLFCPKTGGVDIQFASK